MMTQVTGILSRDKMIQRIRIFRQVGRVRDPRDTAPTSVEIPTKRSAATDFVPTQPLARRPRPRRRRRRSGRPHDVVDGMCARVVRARRVRRGSLLKWSTRHGARGKYDVPWTRVHLYAAYTGGHAVRVVVVGDGRRNLPNAITRSIYGRVFRRAPRVLWQTNGPMCFFIASIKHSERVRRRAFYPTAVIYCYCIPATFALRIDFRVRAESDLFVLNRGICIFDIETTCPFRYYYVYTTHVHTLRRIIVESQNMIKWRNIIMKYTPAE